MKSLLGLMGVSRSCASTCHLNTEELQEKAKLTPKAMSQEEWQALLKLETYHVAREKGTERPWSSCLNDEKRRGTFTCACCQQPLYQSSTKFNSGTGWPSFWSPITNAEGKESVRYETDASLFMTRVEVLCSKCDAHLGHVFNDGPPPTGKRYCMNGVALYFIPDESD